MLNRKFVVVNAFANEPFAGNPAAVFTEAAGPDVRNRTKYLQSNQFLV